MSQLKPPPTPRPILVGAVCIVVLFALTIVVTGDKDSTKLENGLLQFISFAVSTAIAIWIGYVSAREQAKEIVRPHGRKAVRRIVTLGAGIQAIGSTINSERERMGHQAKANDGRIEGFEVDKTLDVLAMQVSGELRVVEDAVEDWRDVVPEDVVAIEDHGDGGTSEDE